MRLYEAFLEDLSVSLLSPREWESVLAHADPLPGPHLLDRFAPGWAFAPQGEGNLGDRLSRIFGQAREEGIDRTVVAGSDAPALSPRDIRNAFVALEEGGVVFAPSPDGGYALIGVSSGVDSSALFGGVRWSTDQALADTLREVRSLGIEAKLLDGVADIDVLADLAPLRSRLELEPRLAPATLRALRDWERG